MSEITEVQIHAQHVDAYIQGIKAGIKIGRAEQAKRVYELAMQSGVSPDISHDDKLGDYVYLNDLFDYMRMDNE